MVERGAEVLHVAEELIRSFADGFPAWGREGTGKCPQPLNARHEYPDAVVCQLGIIVVLFRKQDGG